jgi:hypothetical protein
LNKYRVTACNSSYQLCRFAEQRNFDKNVPKLVQPKKITL